MSFILDGGVYNWIIENGSNTYSVENLISGTLQEGLYQTASVGNTPARQLDVSLWLDPDDEDYPGALDTTQPIVLKLKKIDADGTETIVNKGVYFFDTVEASPYSFQTDFTAFDAMLKTEVVYDYNGTWSGGTTYTIAQAVAALIGVELAEETNTYLSQNAITFVGTPISGPNGTTARQMLSYVGMYHAGNFVINDENELEFVPFKGRLFSPTIWYLNTAGENVAATYAQYLQDPTIKNVVGINASGEFIFEDAATTSNPRVVTFDENGKFTNNMYYSMARLGRIITPEVEEIGDEVVSFDASPYETVTKAEITHNGTQVHRSPSTLSKEQWDALEGKCISCELPLGSTQAICNGIYTGTVGYNYYPYTVSGAYVSPEAKLGTKLNIKDASVILSNRTINIDTLAQSDAQAEATESIQSRYPYINPVTRNLQQQVETAQSSADEAQTAAEDATYRQQTIYKSVASGTTSLPANTTWVTDATGNQNVWTTVRPVYNSSYPVLFVATQKQTGAQYSAGTTCDCTTPVVDQTTTVIDGGHITTGSIDAGRVSTGTLNANVIGANSISVSKLTGNITNGNWDIDLDNGTLTLGDISANNISTGTLTGVTISGNTITGGTISGTTVSGVTVSGSTLTTTGTYPSGAVGTTTIENGTVNSVGTLTTERWAATFEGTGMYVEETDSDYPLYNRSASYSSGYMFLEGQYANGDHYDTHIDGEGVFLNPLPKETSLIDSMSTLSVYDEVINYNGNLVMATITFTGTLASGGTASGTVLSGWEPPTGQVAQGIGYFGTRAIVGHINDDGSINIRNTGATQLTSPNNGNYLIVTFMYLRA